MCHGTQVEARGVLGKCVTSFYFCFFVLAFLELTLYVKGMHHYSCPPHEPQEPNQGGQAWQQGSTVKPAWPSALNHPRSHICTPSGSYGFPLWSRGRRPGPHRLNTHFEPQLHQSRASVFPSFRSLCWTATWVTSRLTSYFQ